MLKAWIMCNGLQIVILNRIMILKITENLQYHT